MPAIRRQLFLPEIEKVSEGLQRNQLIRKNFCPILPGAEEGNRSGRLPVQIQPVPFLHLVATQEPSFKATQCHHPVQFRRIHGPVRVFRHGYAVISLLVLPGSLGAVPPQMHTENCVLRILQESLFVAR